MTTNISNSTNITNIANSSSSSKVRFDGLDVQAMVSYLQQHCIGRRIVNIYDGPNNNETYIWKLDGSNISTNNTGSSDCTNTTASLSVTEDTTNTNTKQFLLIESGIRFHTISTNFTADTRRITPTPFCMKLRKHLRGLRMELIQQISTDRVVLIQCGVGHYKHTIIIELYAKGNLIITDANYTVLALLRSHTYNNNNNTTSNGADIIPPLSTSDPSTSKTSTTNNTNSNAVFVQVGQVYPVSYATSIGTTTTTISAPSGTTTNELTKDDDNDDDDGMESYPRFNE